MTHKQHYNVYIASCSEDGGIYQYKLSGTGEIDFVNFTPLDRPMYMKTANNKMYVLLRAPFKDNNESGLAVFDIDSEGKLKNQTELISTKGCVACHLTIDGSNVYSVNYISGSVIKFPKTVICHSGSGINPVRQDRPHTHYVGITPDNKYVCVTDLGIDTVFLYDKSLNPVSSAKVPDGHGARHLIFSDDGKYMFVANELASTVSAFSYSDGKLCLIDTASCLPQNFSYESTSSAIRFRDGFIYVSNRGHDSISKLTFDGKKLKLSECIDCGGRTPRDFDFAGDFIICCNQDSDSVTLIKSGKDDMFKPENKIKIKAPICVCTDA